MSQHLVCYSQFDRAMARLHLSPRNLCREIGYSGDAHRQWRQKGQMPKVAALACEALIRRAGKSDRPDVLLRGENVRVVDGDATVERVYEDVYVLRGVS